MSSIPEAIRAILQHRPQRVVFFTGAGISADSGVPTFRGPDGLWRDYRAQDLATPEAFERNPLLVWQWYEWRRGIIRSAEPNVAHEALARVPDATVVTQNVDNLHARAGSRNIIELHGNIFRVKCTREKHSYVHDAPFAKLPPFCECGSVLRPDVVWFGEMLPDDEAVSAMSAIRDADLLLVIGTSGVVYPAAGFVAEHTGLSIEINPEVNVKRSACSYAVPERAALAIPPLVDAILDARR